MIAGVLIVVGAYLIGSIAFAVVVSRAFGLPDPHEYGSKSPGATNVLRTGNRKAALLTLIGDGLKGWVAVALAQWLVARWALPAWVVPAAALAAFAGHLWPVYFGFRGGKGVATAAGIVFAFHWPLALMLTVVWLTMAFGFKISSLAGLVTAVLLPLGMYYETGPSLETLACLVIAVLLFWRHRENIRRLIAGKESSIGQ